MILDTFITLFKADTQELKKGVREADRVVEGLEKKLETSDQAATKIGNTFRSLVQSAIGPVTAFLTLSSIIGGIRAAEQYSESIGRISKVLGYNEEAIDSWSGAVERAGGSASSFQSTIASVDGTIQGLSKNVDSDAAKAFKHLGINVKDAHGNLRNFMDILPDLASVFGTLSDQEATDLGKKIGIDYGTIMLLQKGQKEVDALIAREKELGVVTKHDAEVSEKFNQQVNDTHHAFRSFFVTIATDILPTFEKVFKFFERIAVYLREHKTLAVGSIIGIASAMGAYLIPSIFRLITSGKLLNSVFSKWFLIITIISAIGTAIGLVYEDFQVFRAGGLSVIGDLLEKYPELQTIFDDIGDAINWVTGLFKRFNITPSTALSAYLKLVVTIFTQMYKVFKVFWDFFASRINGIINGVKAAGELWQGLKGIGSGIVKLVSGSSNASGVAAGKGIGIGAAKLASGVAAGIGKMDRSPLSVAGSSISNKSIDVRKTSNVNTGNVTINTKATNADEIAGAFSNHLKKQINHATNNYDDGVLA